jgi:uncharacterized protein YukE
VPDGACEQAWTLLGEFLNKDRDLTVEVVDNSDELTAAVAKLEADQVELGVREGAAREKLCEDKWLKTYEKRVRDQQRLEDLVADRQPATDKAAAAAARVRKAAAVAEEKKAEYEALNAKIEKLRSKVDDTRAALRAWDAYRTYRRQRKRLNDEAAALAEEAQNKAQPERPADFAKLADLTAERADYAAALKEARRVVETFVKTGRTACPTCNTPVDGLKDHLDAMKAATEKLPKTIAALDERIDACTEYREAVRAFKEWQAGYEARLRANQKALEGLSKVEAPDGDEDELQKFLDGFEVTRKAALAAHDAKVNAADTLTQAKAAHDAAKARLDEIETGITDNTQDPEKVEKAKRRLAEHRVALQELAKIEGEGEGLRRQIAGQEGGAQEAAGPAEADPQGAADGQAGRAGPGRAAPGPAAAAGGPDQPARARRGHQRRAGQLRRPVLGRVRRPAVVRGPQAGRTAPGGGAFVHGSEGRPGPRVLAGGGLALGRRSGYVGARRADRQPGRREQEVPGRRARGADRQGPGDPPADHGDPRPRPADGLRPGDRPRGVTMPVAADPSVVVRLHVDGAGTSGSGPSGDLAINSGRDPDAFFDEHPDDVMADALADARDRPGARHARERPPDRPGDQVA